MKNTELLPYRQIHLDFHTSPDISGIGADFDPEEFAATLDKARVNSVTCFARCHHGMIYYNSKKHPERVHPHLERRDLLPEQIAACNKKGIRVPVYTTVQWDYYTAQEHPEWLAVGPEGEISGQKPYEAGFYANLCVNTPYRDFLKEHTAEIIELFDPDGFFFDIVKPVDCSCVNCRRDMEGAGIDPMNAAERMRFARRMLDGFIEDMSAFVRARSTKCGIFYNSGHIGPQQRATIKAYSHYELESLPSGGWGYLHFPLSVRYARLLGLEYLGMTGKFHTAWGDFHSFKNAAALQFECFSMIAHGAKCSIGDQLEPRGRLSGAAYDLIGSVYSEIEKKEPWCTGAEPRTEIGIMTPEEFNISNNKGRFPGLMGAIRMLQEGGHQFDVIDSRSDFSRYKLIILPDTIPVDKELGNLLTQFVNTGGRLIASFASGLNTADFADESVDFKNLDWNIQKKPRQVRDSWDRPAGGRHYPSLDYTEYLLPSEQLAGGRRRLPVTEYAMYMKGLDIKAGPDWEVLAQTIAPYFYRDFRRFCSHRQTPSSGNAGSPAILKKDGMVYFSHPVFSQYHQNCPRWCKQLVLNVIDLLLPDPIIRHEGPSGIVVTVNKQPAEDREIIHLLYYVPERRGIDFDIIEDVVPLFNVPVSLQISREPKSIRLVPQGKEIPFSREGERVAFTVPQIAGHQMVSVK